MPKGKGYGPKMSKSGGSKGRSTMYGTAPSPKNGTTRVGGMYGGPVKTPRTDRPAPSMPSALKGNK